MNDDENKGWGKHINDFLLKLSGTKLGQTDFDPNKDYSGEEPPVNLRTFGLLLLFMLVIIAVAAGVMLLFTKVNHMAAIAVLAVIVVACTIVMMRFRK